MEIEKKPFFEQWKVRLHALKAETYALYLAIRDQRTPWYAKAFASLVVAYALSPIDLIPDFIPILGYLDDLLLIPLGIALSLRMIPDEVLADCRARAHTAFEHGKPTNWIAAVMIIFVWIGLAALLIPWFFGLFK